MGLPVGYYRDNFLLLLDEVDRRYPDVLRPGDLDFSRTFRALSLDAQRLYVRLASRQGPVFRSDRLRYPEIGDLHAAAMELERSGLLSLDAPVHAARAVGLLRRGEIAELLQKHTGRASAGVAVEELRRRCRLEIEPTHLERDVRELFHVYEPLCRESVAVYRLLFFGHPAGDLASFVLSDLGLSRYEPYPIQAQDRLFATQAELESALVLFSVRERGREAALVRDAQSLRDIVAEMERTPPAEATNDTRDEILLEAGRALERMGEADAALRSYGLTQAPPSRERRARILARRGAWREALELCRSIEAEPRGEGELAFARRFRDRLARIPAGAAGAGRRPAPTREVLTLGWPPEESVEDAVLRHYTERGWSGLRSENTLWNTLFGLAFWDIVFQPVRGAFLNPFQGGPRDLYTPDFRERREETVRARIQSIRSSPRWIDPVIRTFDERNGVSCSLVAWGRIRREDLRETGERVPAAHAALILDRLSRNLGVHSSGLPDLLLFPPDGQTPYVLVEVKGPGDRLQQNQERWLEFFAIHGIMARVVHARRR